MMRNEDTIRRMADRLVEQFSPEKIILFGSKARGDDTADSDVDFLVIVRAADDRGELRDAMHRAVTGMGLSKHIIVLTASEFEAKRSVPGTIAYPADHEGTVLYAA
jgi:predicted nucleotidyltransferase